MIPPKERRKLNRRQGGALLALIAIAFVALAGLYQISQPHFPGLPVLIPPLFWETPTPKAVALAPTSVAEATQEPPAATPTLVPLPPWLTSHSTPTRPNEPGPTSTP